MKIHTANISFVPQKIIAKLESRIRSNIYRRVAASGESKRKDVDNRYRKNGAWRGTVDHHIYYSCALSISGRTCRLHCDDKVVAKITLPAGWRWKIDGGVAVVYSVENLDIDYHINGYSEFTTITPQKLVASAINNSKKRAEVAALQEVENLLVKGIRVTLQDSILAGNCLRGTLDFASRNGVDEPTIYDGLPAEKLLRMGGRAAIAARIAIARATEWSI